MYEFVVFGILGIIYYLHLFRDTLTGVILTPFRDFINIINIFLLILLSGTIITIVETEATVVEEILPGLESLYATLVYFSILFILLFTIRFVVNLLSGLMTWNRDRRAAAEREGVW